MVGHVSNRDSLENAVDAGSNPSHLAHVQHDNFSTRGEEAIPRSTPSLYPSGTHIYCQPPHLREVVALEQPYEPYEFSANEHYTFESYGERSSHETEARLAAAIHALTLDTTGHDVIEDGELNAARQSQEAKQGRESVDPKIRIPTKASAGEFPSSPKQESGRRTSIEGHVSTFVTGGCLDASTLADTSYRRSCYLGLGTWSPGAIETRSGSIESTSDILPSTEPVDSSGLSDDEISGIAKCAGGQPSSKGSRHRQPAGQSSSTGSKSSALGRNTTSGNRNQKRLSDGSNGQEEDDEQGSGKKLKSTDTATISRLACPFWKHDSTYYCTARENGRYRTCVGPGFRDIQRLKEHLWRTHKDPPICLRCKETLPPETSLAEHLSNKVLCDAKRPRPTRGITSAIEERLRNLRRTSCVSHPEEKWCEIYRVLFPDEFDTPSPYYPAESQCDFNDFAERRMPQVLDEKLDPILRQTLASPELQAHLKYLVMLCHKEVWTSYLAETEADQQVSSEYSDAEVPAERAPEITPNMSAPRAFDRSLLDLQPPGLAQMATHASDAPSGPNTIGPQTLCTTQTPPRSSASHVTPQRERSFRSDSGIGTSSSCSHCDTGTCERCLGVMMPLYDGYSTNSTIANEGRHSYNDSLIVPPQNPGSDEVFEAALVPDNYAYDQYLDDSGFYIQ